MSKLICPFCQQELRKIHPTYVICDNCRITGEDKLWQELIRTRKALEIAVDALDRMAIYDSIYDIIARNAMKRIKELEQKD